MVLLFGLVFGRCASWNRGRGVFLMFVGCCWSDVSLDVVEFLCLTAMSNALYMNKI